MIPEVHGLIVCSRPSSFFNFKELTVPFAFIVTYVSTVLDPPVRLIPEPSPDVPILTAARTARLCCLWWSKSSRRKWPWTS